MKNIILDDYLKSFNFSTKSEKQDILPFKSLFENLKICDKISNLLVNGEKEIDNWLGYFIGGIVLSNADLFYLEDDINGNKHSLLKYYANWDSFKKNIYNFVAWHSRSLDDVKTRLNKFFGFKYNTAITNNPKDLILFVIDYINTDTFNFDEVIDLYNKKIKNWEDCKVCDYIYNCWLWWAIEKVNYYKSPYKPIDYNNDDWDF